MRFPTMWYVRPAKPQISLRIRLCLSLEYSMTVKLLTEHPLEFLSLKGGCTGSSESTLFKMSNCLKSHAAAHLISAYLKTICQLNLKCCSSFVCASFVIQEDAYTYVSLLLELYY